MSKTKIEWCDETINPRRKPAEGVRRSSQGGAEMKTEPVEIIHQTYTYPVPSIETRICVTELLDYPASVHCRKLKKRRLKKERKLGNKRQGRRRRISLKYNGVLYISQAFVNEQNKKVQNAVEEQIIKVCGADENGASSPPLIYRR